MVDSTVALAAGAGGLVLLAAVACAVQRWCRRREYSELDERLWEGGRNPTRERPAAPQRDRKAERRRLDDETAAKLGIVSNFCRSAPHRRELVRALPLVGCRRDKFYAVLRDAFCDRAAAGLASAADGPAAAAAGKGPRPREVQVLLAVQPTGAPAARQRRASGVRIRPPAEYRASRTPSAGSSPASEAESPLGAASAGDGDHGPDLEAGGGGGGTAAPWPRAGAAREPPRLVDFSRSRSREAVRRLLARLKHPSVLETLDAGFSVDASVLFVMRRYSAGAGSLRDLVYRVSPDKAYNHKYRRRGRGRKLRAGRPLPPADVARFSRQILEGLAYLEAAGLPYHHLHSGNVVVISGRCLLTDYENSLLGLTCRVHRQVQAWMPAGAAGAAAGGAARAQAVMFALVLHEMCAGRPLEAVSRGRPREGPAAAAGEGASSASPASSPDDPLRLPRKYERAERVLRRVLEDPSPVTVSDLLAEPLVAAAGDSPPVAPAPLGKRAQALLAPVQSYYGALYSGGGGGGGGGTPAGTSPASPAGWDAPSGDSSAGSWAAGSSDDSVGAGDAGGHAARSAPAAPSLLRGGDTHGEERARRRKHKRKKRARRESARAASGRAEDMW